MLVQQAYTLGMTLAQDTDYRKHARLAVRLTTDQDALIRHAAMETGQSLTQFVTTAALAWAEDTLANRRIFHLDDAAWTQFTELLDRPAQRIEVLAELLRQPAPWDEPDLAQL